MVRSMVWRCSLLLGPGRIANLTFEYSFIKTRFASNIRLYYFLNEQAILRSDCR